MQAYHFEDKQFTRGSLAGDPLVISAFAWFRTNDPLTEQYFLCQGGARQGVRALGVADGCVIATTGPYGNLSTARTTDPMVAAGTWMWACASWDESEVELYVGSRLERARTVPVHVPGSTWWAGCMGGFTGARYFTGDLARWGWVARLLPLVEIHELANGADAPADAQPVAIEAGPRNPTSISDTAPDPYVPVFGPVTGTRKHSRRMG